MGLLVWLVTASRSTFGQIFFVWLTTMVIGLGQMHLWIAGTIEVTDGRICRRGLDAGGLWRLPCLVGP